MGDGWIDHWFDFGEKPSNAAEDDDDSSINKMESFLMFSRLGPK